MGLGRSGLETLGFLLGLNTLSPLGYDFVGDASNFSVGVGSELANNDTSFGGLVCFWLACALVYGMKDREGSRHGAGSGDMLKRQGHGCRKCATSGTGQL